MEGYGCIIPGVKRDFITNTMRVYECWICRERVKVLEKAGLRSPQCIHVDVVFTPFLWSSIKNN